MSTVFTTAEKAEYRSAVWRAFARIAEKQPDYALRDSHVLILPGPTDHEIRQVLGWGVPEHHIHCVERNPAKLAHYEWKKDYPNVHRYGVSVGRACEKIADAGVTLRAANFDFCGNFSWSLVEDVRRAASSGAFPEDGCFSLGFTALKGRESSATTAALRLLFNESRSRDGLRVRAFAKAFVDGSRSVILRGERPYDEGGYRSQSQVMEWAVFGLLSTPERPGGSHRKRDGWAGNGRTLIHPLGREPVAIPRPTAAEMGQMVCEFYELRNMVEELTSLLMAVLGHWRADTTYRHGRDSGGWGEDWCHVSRQLLDDAQEVLTIVRQVARKKHEERATSQAMEDVVR